jgi:hypothetical protein
MLNCEDRLAAEPTAWRTEWLGWPALILAGSGCGYLPEACRSPAARP